jgi:transcriptional regulator with GAF, ATPase, and Fis domain
VPGPYKIASPAALGDLIADNDRSTLDGMRALVDMVRAVSVDPDPVRSRSLFVHTIREVYGNVGLLTIGTRGAPTGHYRLTRLLHQPGVGGEDLDYTAEHAPVHAGGFLGDVTGHDSPVVLETTRVEDDPILGNRLQPYRSFVVFPVITAGEIGGHVVQFSTEPGAFAHEVVVARFLSVSFMASSTHAKRVAMELDEAKTLNARLEAQRAYLTESVELRHHFEDIVGESAVFKRVLKNVEQVAETDATVLILGESGTGKELLARAVHRISRRHRMPLIKVNCATLPSNLIESELFGHERGAFTGAVRERAGRFELADGGTIFLDEIGEMALDLQAKLLRVLQEGEFERVGEGRTRRVDVRVVAATNRDLQAEVDAGRFRDDLYYRLNVFPLLSPPLRERQDDIPALAYHFLSRYSAKIGKRVQHIPAPAMNALRTYPWPGNIRELQNIIERGAILTDGYDLDLSQAFGAAHATSAQPEGQTLADNERVFIRNTLAKCDWRIQGKEGAAARLGIAPSSLRSRMKRLGITR